MEIRFQESPEETRQLDAAGLRKRFLVSPLFVSDKVNLLYTHYDRMIVGGVKPVKKSIDLPIEPDLRASYFLERRELGIINVGGIGTIIADGKEYLLSKLDCLYLGKGTKKVRFKSSSKKTPALFYLLSAPAHRTYPNKCITLEKASPVLLGEATASNRRTIYKYIHADGIKSCQLVMGLTMLESGNVWNSIPPHTHTRRMEIYFYFDLPKKGRVFHFMGQPHETRHLLVANHEAVISPPWSIHFGCGSTNYGFIWGMAGENQEFSDMDPAPIETLK